MNYLHQELTAGPEDRVEVTLDAQANVMLLDDTNFDRYRRNQAFQYYGGHAEKSPFVLVPPSRGRWHVVVDLGGGPGRVRAAVQLIENVNR
jgi:hypothetical protein